MKDGLRNRKLRWIAAAVLIAVVVNIGGCRKNAHAAAAANADAIKRAQAEESAAVATKAAAIERQKATEAEKATVEAKQKLVAASAEAASAAAIKTAQAEEKTANAVKDAANARKSAADAEKAAAEKKPEGILLPRKLIEEGIDFAPLAAMIVAPVEKKTKTEATAATPVPPATIPETGKPRGDYVPCLFTREDRMRFKDAMRTGAFLGAAQKELQRQSFLNGIPAGNIPAAMAILSTVSSASQLSGMVDAPAFQALIDPAHTKDIKDGLQRVGAASPALSPFDVSCSQSILTWEETKDIFGRRLADTYVAIQVVVRNLSPDKEFLMHDVQVAIDHGPSWLNGTDPGTRYDKRFVAGRDKLLVRGVALRGQSDDPRNRFIRIAETLGDIAGAISPALGKALDFRSGVSIYRTAFIPGLKSIFPDYTIDQINRLNDLGFSANSAYKLVIPTNGAAPFVTFLPSKIFADNYRNWKTDELQALSEQTYVVFAGVHITEDSNNQATASKLVCPDKSGNLDLSPSNIKDGTLTCTLTADNLATVSKVRLKNALDSTDGAVVEADVATSGSVAFNADKLKALNGAEYAVYLVDKSSKETATAIRVKFVPVVDSVAAIVIGGDACTASLCKVAVKGSNLGMVTNITFAKGAITVSGTLDGSGNATFKPGVAMVAGDYKVSITVGGNSSDTGQTVNVSLKKA